MKTPAASSKTPARSDHDSTAILALCLVSENVGDHAIGEQKKFQCPKKFTE
jgi:hypothetical protein